MTGKQFIPIVKRANGEYAYEFLGQNWKCAENELDSVESKIRNTGAYYFVTTPDEFKDISEDSRKIDELFLKLTLERLEGWIKIADEFLHKQGRRIYVTGGNDDRFEIDDLLKRSEYMTDCEGQVLEIDSEHEMLSTGYSNITPWRCPRDITEEELGRRIESMAQSVRDMSRCIFNLHVPPVDCRLDTCAKLDDSVVPPRPIMDGGNMVMYGAGSSAVRAAIEKHQPLLGLHGHIHESPGVVKVGKTLCLNPGSEYSEGIIRGAIVTCQRDKVVGYQLTSG